MAIHISEKTQKQVDELLASGRYANSEEVVASAIKLLSSQERKLAWLKAELKIAQDQIDRGELIEFTREYADSLKQRAIENARSGKPVRDAVKP